MRGPHNIFRLIRTGATLERTGAMNIILSAYKAPWRVRLVAKVIGWPFQWLGYKGDPSMPPATRALTALGPAYIKFGQILSTRPDVVGNELAAQMRVLQDKLPPFPMIEAQKMIEAELGQPLSESFKEFSEPVAAASIAQVHRAKLVSDGSVVAVKVLRPGIEKAFQRDIDAFYFAAKMVEILAPSSRRLRPVEVIQHFEGVVLGELDLRLESSSAGEFAKNTEKDVGFQLPKVNWSLSGKNIMTLDWVEGISAGDNKALDAAGHSRKNISERILQLFLKHALRDGFFHADLHQGNLKISSNGDIIAYDFGIMGRIDEYTRRVYAEILFGFIRRDYKRVAEVHFEAGYVPADKDVDEFAQALRAVGEPIFGMDATQISMGRVLTYLFNVTEQFGMETRTELILLQRTMVVVEGVARSLHPQINIWEVASPIVQDYIKESIGPKALAKDLLSTLRVLARFGPKLPQLAEAALIRTYNSPQLDRKHPRGLKRWVLLALMVGLFVGWFAPHFF
ncbi:MAG: 2-polyprenylphenol 6-hydroxylase, partial [Planktomarina sp.]|nr:2-polyprenylphenol 6-hydroxylase [Planktomarina sp.]